MVQHHMARGEAHLGLLPLSLPLEQAENFLRQVEGAHGGAVFGLLLYNGGAEGGAGLPNVDEPALEVHVFPLQAAQLLPAQAEAARQLGRQLQTVAAEQGVEPLELIGVVEVGLIQPGAGGSTRSMGEMSSMSWRTAVRRAEESRSWWRRRVLEDSPVSRCTWV